MGPQSLADQFLLVDGYTDPLAPELPYSNDSQSIDCDESEMGGSSNEIEDDEDINTPHRRNMRFAYMMTRKSLSQSVSIFERILTRRIGLELSFVTSGISI
mmetsp:Transcript_10720/g.20645  ORF Transcript_10720/g.20645 Transcript_10720/m.20645 type:complete len:101 (-) Transcript_10720:197-499(-)|eukprot:scaffold790_cov119-Amphora_coffeaeformis.AAC.4